jgi:hypothetical protein
MNSITYAVSSRTLRITIKVTASDRLAAILETREGIPAFARVPDVRARRIHTPLPKAA